MNYTYLFCLRFRTKIFYHLVDRNDWFEFSKSIGHSTRQRLDASRLDCYGFEGSFCFHNFLTFPNLIKCSEEIDKQLLWHFPCRNWVLVAIKPQSTVYHQRDDLFWDDSWAKRHSEFGRSAGKSLASHLKYRCWIFWRFLLDTEGDSSSLNSTRASIARKLSIFVASWALSGSYNKFKFVKNLKLLIRANYLLTGMNVTLLVSWLSEVFTLCANFSHKRSFRKSALSCSHIFLLLQDKL